MEINSISSFVTNTNASSAQSGVTPVTDEQVKPQLIKDSVVSPNLMTQQETKERLQIQVDNVNSKLNQLGIGLAFSVDESTQSSVFSSEGY